MTSPASCPHTSKGFIAQHTWLVSTIAFSPIPHDQYLAAYSLNLQLYSYFATTMSPSVNSPAPAASGAQGNDTYPEQRHAGAAGIGPEYGKGVTTGDKYEGLKEEAKGKILRKPELAEHGRKLRTGELKGMQEAENNTNPSNTAAETDKQRAQGQAPKSDENQFTAQPPGVPDTSHPTEAGRMRQAATVAPEGTSAATKESQGEHRTRSIG